MISIIAAIGKNRELGSKNKLLWHIPGELKRFRQLTVGHPVIMGRRTFESIGHPLKDRQNFVVSKQRVDKELQHTPDVCWAGSLEEAIEQAKKVDEQEIFIIGGAQIYAQALPLADKLYLTLIDASFPEADVFFPDYSRFNRQITKRRECIGEYWLDYLELTPQNTPGV